MGTRILGAILGAIAAPIVLVMMVMVVHKPPSHDNWDWATPALTLMAATAALFVGGLAGAMIATSLQRGATREAGIIATGLLLLLATFPGWLLWIKYGPAPKVRPATEGQRAKWADEHSAFLAKHDPGDHHGLTLAWELRTALRDNGFDYLGWREYRRGEDSIAANGVGYKLGDDGWRYDIEEGPPRRAIVFQDPRLERAGPIFEVEGAYIFRRQNRDAPAFSTDQRLAGVLRLPDCIARFAALARADGRWDGEAHSLPALIADGWTPVDGCGRITVYERPERPGQPWQFEVSGEPTGWARFTLVPDSSSPETPFQFRYMVEGRGYFREANGAWHVRARGPALISDPPPAACLFDLTVPCDR